MTRFSTLALLLAASLGVSGCGVARMAGLRTSIENEGGPCRWINGFSGGTEDVAVDPASGALYVSADPRDDHKLGKDAKPGGIWLVKMEGGEVSKIEVTGGQPVRFHPHGIAIWNDPDPNERRMFVINHQPEDDPSRIEIFRIRPDGSLEWLGGKAYELLPRPNDLVAVGRDAYYAANDHGSPRARSAANPFAAENRETLLALRKASVVFVKDGVAKVARSGMAFPAGITSTPDYQRIFVGQTSIGEITVFDRAADDTLSFVDSHRAGPMPDNLTYADGRIWYGAHSRLWNFLRHFMDPQDRQSPGRVETMDPADGGRDVRLREDGENLTTLSVGAPYRGGLVVGSIDQHSIGFCELAKS